MTTLPSPAFSALVATKDATSDSSGDDESLFEILTERRLLIVVNTLWKWDITDLEKYHVFLAKRLRSYHLLEAPSNSPTPTERLLLQRMHRTSLILWVKKFHATNGFPLTPRPTLK